MTAIPEVPTPNAAETARQIAQQVRATVETLPGLVFITPDERIRLAVSATVPDRFLEACAAAMDESTALSAVGKISAAQLRTIVATAQANLALADELERLARGVRDTVKVARAEAGTEALRVYSVARRLNRPRDAQSSVSTLVQMQRTLNRGRGRLRAVEPEPTGAPGGAQCKAARERRRRPPPPSRHERPAFFATLVHPRR